MLDLCCTPRFADQAPGEIYASLLDEGVYHCFTGPHYRILGQHGEVRERLASSCGIQPIKNLNRWRNVRMRCGPGTSPSRWDPPTGPTSISTLSSTSSAAVGWLVGVSPMRKSAAQFKPLFDDAITKHDVPPGQFAACDDRGGPMKAKATALPAR